MQHYLTNSSFPHCWVCFFAAAGLGHLGLGAMHDSSSSASSIKFSLLIRKIFFSIQGTLLDHVLLWTLLWTLLLANIFTLARLKFELEWTWVKRPVRLFFLAQKSNPMVKLLVKLADKAINGHNNMSCQTCTIFVFDLVWKTMHERKPMLCYYFTV